MLLSLISTRKLGGIVLFMSVFKTAGIIAYSLLKEQN